MYHNTTYPVLLKILGLQKNIKQFSKMLHFQWFGLGISWGFPGLPLRQKMAVTLSHSPAASPTILVGIPIHVHLVDFMVYYIHTYTYIYHKNQPNVGNYTTHGSYGIFCWNAASAPTTSKD